VVDGFSLESLLYAFRLGNAGIFMA
jgi:hypothetical protein